MPNIHYILITITVLLYLLGRLCDDLGWYTWDGLSTDGFEGIALGALATSAILTIARRSYEEDGLKILFLESQMRFIIPWALIILIIILLFNIFGCRHGLDAETEASDLSFYMDNAGCCLYSVVILLTNLNYSVLCNPKGDLPLLIFYEITLFAQIIYNGTLFIHFINQLKEHSKDYSILFVSIFIAWQVIVMDLLFRGAYEEREKEFKHQKLQKMVHEHRDVCDVYQQKEGLDTERKLQLDTTNKEPNVGEVDMNVRLPAIGHSFSKK